MTALREVTRSPTSVERSLIMVSVIPSAQYSLASDPIFRHGRIAMVGRSSLEGGGFSEFQIAIPEAISIAIPATAAIWSFHRPLPASVLPPLPEVRAEEGSCLSPAESK